MRAVPLVGPSTCLAACAFAWTPRVRFLSPVCRRQDIMAPPQPPTDTKPVKSQDDYINHGRDQLMSFLMTLRAIAIYGIATDWHDFDDAARVHAQDELTEAQLRDSCSDALDKIQHAPVIVANHELNARRLSELRRPDRGEGDAAADDDGADDGNDGADDQAPDAPAARAPPATTRAATIHRQEGYFGEREVQALALSIPCLSLTPTPNSTAVQP